MCTLATLEVGSLQRSQGFSFTAGLSTVVTAWVTQLGSTFEHVLFCVLTSVWICTCMSVDVCKSVGSVGVYLCVWMCFTVQC